jgi:hypothetical protein
VERFAISSEAQQLALAAAADMTRELLRLCGQK